MRFPLLRTQSERFQHGSFSIVPKAMTGRTYSRMTHGDMPSLLQSYDFAQRNLSPAHVLVRQTGANPQPRCSVMKILSKPAPSNFCHDLTLRIDKHKGNWQGETIKNLRVRASTLKLWISGTPRSKGPPQLLLFLAFSGYSSNRFNCYSYKSLIQFLLVTPKNIQRLSHLFDFFDSSR